MARRKRRSFDDAVGDKGGFGSGNTGRLNDWREAGSVVVFLHADSGITARLFHLIPYATKDDDGKKVIRYFPFVCHEEPETYFSKAPAQHCPICRAIDQLADDGSVEDDEIIWSVKIGNKKKDRESAKEDFCGFKSGDWRGSFKPRAQYVMAVVNTEKPEDGLQIDVEPQSLGDALMSVIRNEIDGNGQEMGDPRINPYAFKFTYDKDAAPKDMYDAFAYRRAELTNELAALLESPAIDIDSYIDPGDSKMLRQIMEQHFKADIDLDELFDNVLDEHEESSDEPADEPEDDGGHDGPDMDNLCETCDGKGTIGKKKMECPDCEGTGRANGSEEETSEEPEMVPCKTCDGLGTIGKKKTKCPDCDGDGLVPADEDASEEEPEEEPKETKEERRKRKKREAERERRAKKKAEQEAAKEAESEEGDDVGDVSCGGCHRMIPEDADKCPYCGVEFDDENEEDD